MILANCCTASCLLFLYLATGLLATILNCEIIRLRSVITSGSEYVTFEIYFYERYFITDVNDVTVILGTDLTFHRKERKHYGVAENLTEFSKFFLP